MSGNQANRTESKALGPELPVLLACPGSTACAAETGLWELLLLQLLCQPVVGTPRELRAVHIFVPKMLFICFCLETTRT